MSTGDVAPSPPLPYPLLFRPVLLEKVWGGRRLGQLGKSMASASACYGESWELADLGETSAGGAGGGAVRSIIDNGPLAGRTLHEAIVLWGNDLLGCADAAERAERGGFPLLVKFLDAAQNLSVQVHPSPAYLRSHPNAKAHLKTESWYIVDAEPGASLYIGVKPGLTRAEFAAHIRDGTVTGDLLSVPAVPGECHTLPSGTVHALGAGVLVAEVQTPSDTTFRVFDWGRSGRELHIEQSLASATFADTPGPDRVSPPPPPSSLHKGQLCGRLATTEFYTIDEFRSQDGDDVTIGYRCPCAARPPGGPTPAASQPSTLGGGCFVLLVLGGSGFLSAPDSSFNPIHLRTGQTVLVPAAISARATLRAERSLRVLRIGVA